MATDGERITMLEATLSGLRDDVREVKEETLRTRRRLHNLEGISGALVDVNRRRQEEDERRERKYTNRLNLLMVLATFAAVISPVVVGIISHTG